MAGTTLSRREAAEYLGVHKNTIRNLEKRGELAVTHVKVGRGQEARYKLSDLAALRDERGEEGRGNSHAILRPLGLTSNPEAARIWAAYEQTMEDLQAIRIRNATLENEVAQLRSRLEAAEGERKRLLDTVIDMTSPSA